MRACYTFSVKTRPKNSVIRGRLLRWFSIHRRDLPWRRTNDPYAILVSEVMLQQTQVDRVIPKYRAWLKTFPTVQSLARAPLRKVLKLWSGLGYNSRGKRLRDLAQVVVKEHHGKIPTAVHELEKLPGIGPYTARAVASFAFGQDEPVIDTNVRRVVSRIFFGLRGPAEKSLKRTVRSLAPTGATHDWNAALMDFGALVCQSRQPKCATCPVQQYCRAYPAVLKPQTRTGGVPFHDSDRFWRGRIVKTLVHDGPLHSSTLRETMRGLGSLSVARFQRLLRDLAVDGIVRRQGQRLSIQP